MEKDFNDLSINELREIYDLLIKAFNLALNDCYINELYNDDGEFNLKGWLKNGLNGGGKNAINGNN